jgi:hypothetical protein
MLIFQIMAVLNFHYKVYRHETILIFSNKETILYYWDRFIVFFGLKEPILADEGDNTVLPPVRIIYYTFFGL